MGGSTWSDSSYTARVDAAAASGRTAFHYSDTSARLDKSDRKIHPTLDPKGVKVRESRDSAAHPLAVPISVIFDTTGSMGGVPVILQKALPKLMGLLIGKNYVEDPQIMVGAINDCQADNERPLQVGQFESGIEIDENLGNLLLEGGGGGTNQESYELALYFLARHTAHDAWEKRGRKGYVFLIGDEEARNVSAREVKKYIGDDLQADIPLAQIVEELKERYEVFFIIPGQTSNCNASWLSRFWEKLLGQHVLKLEDPATVSDLIAATIGTVEATVDPDALRADLAAAGSSSHAIAAVTTAVSRVTTRAANGTIAKSTAPASKRKPETTSV